MRARVWFSTDLVWRARRASPDPNAEDMTGISHRTETAERHAHLRLVESGSPATFRRGDRPRSRQELLERLQLFAALRARPPVFAHWSAALIHGLPFLNSPPLTIHVVATGPYGHASRGVVSYPRPVEMQVERRHGLLVTSAAQTVADLAGHTSFEEGVVFADHVLTSGPFGGRTPLTTGIEIAAAAERLVDAGEGSRALAVARFADGRASSPLESISRATMALAGAPAPELQYAVHDLDGQFAQVAFGWPTLRLAGEVDSTEKLLHPVFHRSRDAQECLAARTQRQRRIEASGLRIIRWNWETGRRVDRMREFLVSEGVPLDPVTRHAELGLGT